MRSRFPSYLDWQNYIEAELKSAFSTVRLETRLINGASTNLKPKVKKLDDLQASLPFAEVILATVLNGHDDKQSAQKSWDSYDYTRLGSSNKYIKTETDWLERLQFQVNIYSNRYSDVLACLDECRRYFSPVYLLNPTWNGKQQNARVFFEDVSMARGTTDAQDNPEEFIASFVLTVQTQKDSASTTTQVPSIQTLSASLSASF